MKKRTRWQDWTVIAAGAFAALSVLWTAQAPGRCGSARGHRCQLPSAIGNRQSIEAID